MITMTWTEAPADLTGPSAFAVRGCAGLDTRTLIGVSPATPAAPFQGSGVPAGVAVRLRPAVQAIRTQAQDATYDHNFIGTTLGIHSSRRPQS